MLPSWKDVFLFISPLFSLIAQRFCKTKQSLFVWAPAESTIAIISLCQFAELTQQQYYEFRCPCFHLNDVMVVFFFVSLLFCFFKTACLFSFRCLLNLPDEDFSLQFRIGHPVCIVKGHISVHCDVFCFLVQCQWLSIRFYLTCCQILLNTKINSHA